MEMGSIVNMDLQEDSSRLGSLPATTSRNMSSSSSAFFSANQSPFFSPRSSTCQLSESTRSDAQCDSSNLSADPPSSCSGIQDPECLANVRFALSDMSLTPAAYISSDFQKFDLCHLQLLSQMAPYLVMVMCVTVVILVLQRSTESI